PDAAGDLMSYASSRWTSKWNYYALMTAIAGTFPASAQPILPANALPSPPPPPPPPVASTPVLLVQGLIPPSNNTVEFLPCYQAAPGFFDFPKVAESFNLASDLPPSWPYRVRLLDASGAVLIDTALLLHAAFEDEREQIGFLQYVPFDPRARFLQAV